MRDITNRRGDTTGRWKSQS